MILSILKLSVNSMRLGARYQAIAIYSKRFVNWFHTNAPYLSGDGFSLLADYNYRAPKYWGLVRRRKKIVMARTVFCPSHYLEDFLENHFSDIRCETLILGNSDRNFSDFDYQLPTSVSKVFIQNLNFTRDGLRLLPIGIENRRLGRNGFTRVYKNTIPWDKKLNRILIGPFSNTHTERGGFQEYELMEGPWDVHQNFLSFHEFSEIASMHKFIACPQGNGLDTHRFWESLYRGSIPFVLKSSWSSKVKELGIPLVELNSWKAIEVEEAIKNGLDLNFEPKKIKALWLDYWKEEF